MPAAIAAMSARPPITPPTIGPIGVECVGVGEGDGGGVGSVLEDETGGVTITEDRVGLAGGVFALVDKTELNTVVSDLSNCPTYVVDTGIMFV